MPERSCIACREKRPKVELIRLVCNASVVEIDPKGKKAGRGVYLCPTRECWETGLKSNRLEYALRTKLTLENRQSLLEYGRRLPEKGECRVE
ncbi:MAG: YlxR family protein [Chloroflexi bacterium]|nr:YlxR family protein [Chloroflexota bacterium]